MFAVESRSPQSASADRSSCCFCATRTSPVARVERSGFHVSVPREADPQTPRKMLLVPDRSKTSNAVTSDITHDPPIERSLL